MQVRRVKEIINWVDVNQTSFANESEAMKTENNVAIISVFYSLKNLTTKSIHRGILDFFKE